MKKLNIIYWIVTGLFAAAMSLGSISNVTQAPEAVDMISTQLGYPQYIIPFLGIAKILGSIAILLPNLRRIKEWAYAGLFFDLVGAVYSMFSKFGFQPQSLFMIVFFGLLFGSYYLWHKKLETA
jgi:uncharacterized membrane protein